MQNSHKLFWDYNTHTLHNYKDLLSEGLIIVDWELVKLNVTVITFYLH